MPDIRFTSQKHFKGFTLLEVMITISLLAVMVLAVSELLKGSIDMRIALSEKEQVTSRLNVTLDMIKQDIEHAYLLSVNKDKELVRNGQNHTYFKIETFASKTTISFTTLHPRSMPSNTSSGELAKVMYEIKESKRHSPRMALWRGSMPVNIDKDVNTELISEGIRSLSVELWNGSAWLNNWDSTKSEFRDALPRLVRITLKAYLRNPEYGAGTEDVMQDSLMMPTDDHSVSHQGERRTIVYLPWAKRFPEIKDKTKTLRF
ncbi:MAG: prepilin-type N-terminal cleavage/methylation domain-containing protein [Proteobacteria bacterium]|nr:prepilin-type N-terminal cleavage/methylation domain-containing protein [Pseudomonadota bacterium]